MPAVPKPARDTCLAPMPARAALSAALLATLLGVLTATWASPAAAGLKLHVPSPDWRDQVIYFLVTDRFADGDPSNNDQGAGEFAAGQRSRYNGGDLKGVAQRLDYIQGLGATAVWITPPVANQWLDPAGTYTGYHGYWAEHFKQVDRHLGTLDDYRALSDALHRRGMHLVQDIVVNHTGNFYTYRDRWQAGDPQRAWRGYEPHDLTRPVPRPSQSPFDRNDPRDPAQRAQAIYHWTPDVVDFTVKEQELNFQMSGLDDLNTENPVVRRALRDSYGFWIREVGVDAFRVDTAFYVPPDYFADFLRATDPQAPGIDAVARATGRRQFHVFGEGFALDKPYQDQAAAKIDRFMRGPGGQRLMPGMLNFPLYGALGDAFARGRPTAELAHRITRTMQLHAQPHLMPTFLDNHDVDRFLAGGDVTGLRQALLAQMTLPGIPVIYYGTEQGFIEQRAAMFAAGWGSGGRDRYDTSTALYREIAALTALRRAHRVFSRGVPKVRHANAVQAGALAWTMRHGRQTALVVFNTADHDALVPAMATGLRAGTRLRGLHDMAGGVPQPLVLGAQGRITLRMPPRSARVWLADAQPAAVRPGATAGSAAAPRLSMDALARERVAGDFMVSGLAHGAAQLQLVVDGDLSRATPVTPGPDGRWQATVDTSRMVDPALRHSVSLWAAGQQVVATRHFLVDRPWQLVADVPDPAGDDRGLSGQVEYPTDPGWGPNRQMDLRGVKAYTSGGALRLEVAVNRITTVWNPPNGFDHVLFTVFIELPGQAGGATVMPLQGGSLPEGMRWHRRLRVGGWSNALFDDQGATAADEGRPLAPGASVQVDLQRQTVSFTVPAAVLGRAGSLSGAKVLVTTWDYDGGYRALLPQAQPYAMGGGVAGEPKVMDSSPVIVLP